MAFEGRKIEDLKSHLESALRESGGVSNLGLDVGYPRTFGRNWEKQRIDSIGAARSLEAASAISSTERLLTDLKARHQALYVDLSRGAQNVVERLSHRYALASRLLQQYDQSFGPRAGHSKSLFGSCHFKVIS